MTNVLRLRRRNDVTLLVRCSLPGPVPMEIPSNKLTDCLHHFFCAHPRCSPSILPLLASNQICSRTHNTWLGSWQSSEYQTQPARARLSLFMLKAENLANSPLIGARTGKIVKRALRCFNDMAPDERRALSRSLFTALYAALPFENRPSREIILSEL